MSCKFLLINCTRLTETAEKLLKRIKNYRNLLKSAIFNINHSNLTNSIKNKLKLGRNSDYKKVPIFT